jgi:hypothetical protein
MHNSVEKMFRTLACRIVQRNTKQTKEPLTNIFIYFSIKTKAMKNLSISTHCTKFLFLAIVAIFSNCSKDEPVASPCESDKGLQITSQVGRIYKWNGGEPSFFYIGNVQPVTTGVNGGYISCSELPIEFHTEGLIVVYSGINKGPSCEACDPLFWFISLSSIKKSE